MRASAWRAIISPPLVISKSEIDTLIERAWMSLDQAEQAIRADGLMQSAA